MKERGPIPERLTSKPLKHRLVREGVPLMPEEGREASIPPKTPESSKTGRHKPSEEAVRKAWAEIDKGRTLDADERWVREELIRMRAMPISGGSGEIGDEGSGGGRPPAPPAPPGEPPEPGDGDGDGERLTPDETIERLRRAGRRREADELSARERGIGEELARRIIEGRLPPEMEAAVAREIARMRAEEGTERDPFADLRRRVRDHKTRERAFRERIGPPHPDEVEALRVEGATLADEINSIIDESPVIESQLFPPTLLEPASAFKETRERLINRILFRAFEDPTETRDYSASMNLYAQSHLEVLLGFLERDDPERYVYYQGLETSAQLFHVMNARLIGGNLDQFMGIAANLNNQHFTFMQGLSGVSEAMRKFEEKYQEFLAKDDRITPENYEELKKQVKEALEASNGIGLLESEFTGNRRGTGSERRKMKDWEIERAVNIARTFYNITFRSAELISQGQIPEPLKQYLHSERRYSSFPLESAVKIMNWMQWTLDRFQIAAARGGVSFINMAKNNYFEFLRDKRRKLGINRIVKFGGMKTDEVEVGAMFGVSGIYGSWRLEDMSADSFKVTIGGETISVREWLIRNQDTERDAAGNIIRLGVADALEKARRKATQADRDAFYNAINPLIENLDIGLGWLIKSGMLGGEAGYNVRKRLWEKVAENNLPLMVNYLSKLQFGEVESVKKKDHGSTVIERKINPDGPIDSSPLAFRNLAAGWTEAAIATFKTKISLAHEKRIAEAAGKDVAHVNIVFTPEEQVLVDRIKNAGRQLAPQLADIAFPYVPFLNDIPFELLDYRKPGNEFYKRRNGDLVNYNKAQGAFIGIMNNPGGMNPEDALKHYDEIVKGIESPQGTTDALERVFPMFKTWVDIIETTPGFRQIVVKGIRQSLHKATSIAQEWAGIKALSADEHQVPEIIEEAHKAGILDHALAEELKKKKHVTWIWRLFAIFRDYWYMPLVIGSRQFASQMAK